MKQFALSSKPDVYSPTVKHFIISIAGNVETTYFCDNKHKILEFALNSGLVELHKAQLTIRGAEGEIAQFYESEREERK